MNAPILPHGWVTVPVTLFSLLPLGGQAQQPKFALAATPENFQLGSGFCGLGDLNDDGVPDFAVADRARSSGGFPASGIVYLVSGADGATIRAYGGTPAGMQYFGGAMAALDANGDGTTDLAVGAPGHSDGAGFGAGAVWIYSGADGSVLSVVIGPSGSQYGSALANAGDQDGDGCEDLYVGAPYADGYRGAVFVQSGSDGSRIRTIASDASLSAFGLAVEALDDGDGDGRPEVAISAPGFRVGGNPAGRVSLVRSSDGAVVGTAVGSGFYNRLGESLAAADDANGDGRSDLLVGSYSGGTALLVSGADLSVVKDLTVPSFPAFKPMIVGGSLDFDHDGTSDFLIGSTGFGPSGTTTLGAVRIVSGAGASTLFEFAADVANTGLGSSVKVLPRFGFAVGAVSAVDPISGGRGIAYCWEVEQVAPVHDSDGDGVPDDEDPYPNSILDPTVVLFGVDSGVANWLGDDGSSLADLLSELEDLAERGQGAYISSLNGRLGELLESGLLTKTEVKALRLAAVRGLAGSRK